MNPRPHVLIIVQNLPVPLDRRVWLECQALRDAGYEVSVICPKGPDDPSYELHQDVHLYKYRPPPEASAALGFALEFVYCWFRTAWLSLRVARRRRIDVIQACNPPDTFWALARLWRLATGGRTRFVFDHHDLNPELFLSRFGAPTTGTARVQFGLLRWLERRTFRAADRVISTNESYRGIAVQRGGVPRAHTAVVRSGPDTARMRPLRPDPGLSPEGTTLLVYLGIMGPQDGVDVVLHVADQLLRAGRRIHVALLGFGDSFDSLVALSRELGIDRHVTFTGRADADTIARYLSAAAIGLSPDPYSPLNDVSTMNKTMEYMAYALPVVAFDLTETRVSGGDAAVYVDHGGSREEAVARFAEAVAALLDDQEGRERRGLSGRRRAEQVLDWEQQRLAYLSVYDELTGRRSPAPPPLTYPEGPAYVDVTDDDALLSFRRLVTGTRPAELDLR